MNQDSTIELDDSLSLLVNRPSAPDGVRADILNAAATIFNERGYAATSIDDVADRLGASKGRIYHYYRSKTDIFLDLHLESLRVLTDARSEEHTSELQSLMAHLVCRLMLEKKKS